MPVIQSDRSERKPGGPIDQIRRVLAKNAERIRSGKFKRPEFLAAIEAKGLNRTTAINTSRLWLKANDLSFIRPVSVRLSPKLAAKAAVKKPKR